MRTYQLSGFLRPVTATEVCDLYGMTRAEFAYTVGEPESRLMTCPECNGDGGFESLPSRCDTTTGQPITHWITCTACGGDGECEIEVSPVEMDDLDEGKPT